MKQAEGEFSTAPGRTFEEAKQSWHDESRPNTFASVVKDENVPRRRQANVSISHSIVRKWGIWDWSEDAWDPATAHHLTGSVVITNQRFKEEVPGTFVLNMSGVSGSMSVSIASAAEADPSQPTLRVEAVLPGNLSTKLVSRASSNRTFRAEVPISGTPISNLPTNLNARSGAGDRHGQHENGSIVVHPVTSESIPERTLDVMCAPEPNGSRPNC